MRSESVLAVSTTESHSATQRTVGTRRGQTLPDDSNSRRLSSGSGARGLTAWGTPTTRKPTFRELATDWLDARKQNPAIRPRTIELNEWQLRRYLAPFFGDLLPSQITSDKVKQYRRRIHAENTHIRAAAEADAPLRDPRSRQPLRTLSNDSINKTLRTLAAILDEAEDVGFVVSERRTWSPHPRAP